MSIPTLVIALTLLSLSHALLWHNQTAENLRQKDPGTTGDNSK
jgi:hypothetical protein